MMVNELEDQTLLTRMAGGDMIAIEAKYHTTCLVNLHNRYRSHLRKKNLSVDNNERMMESRAFVELIEYIDTSSRSGIHVFKLSEIHHLYTRRLSSLGVEKSVNKTRLKDKILEHFPECTAQTDGRSIVMIFDQCLRILMRDVVKERDFTDDAIILSKAAKIIRKDVFTHQQFQFNGTFHHGCQRTSAPSSLMSLVALILNGPNVEGLGDDSQACLTIAQIIDFNVKTKAAAANSRHSLDREPPLPIYLGLDVHSRTRSKVLINELHRLGLSVSYHRVMEIEEWLATSVSERYDNEGVVCPAQLRRGLFTSGALDNLDHNPSSNTAEASFHGTSISLFQNVDKSHPGEKREPIRIPPISNQKHHIPDHYAIVPSISLNMKSLKPKLTTSNSTIPVDTECLGVARMEESQWLKHASSILDMYDNDSDEVIAWSAYHASIRVQPESSNAKAVTALLPLFAEKAAEPSMVKHGMDTIREAVNLLNPGQVPVVAVDQPIFAIAKSIQWKWPAQYGEQVYVTMLGGLHIEMALWRTLGDILANSGWTDVLACAGVTTSGTADSFLKSAHLKRTRNAHQITALALSKLQDDSFLMNDDNDEQNHDSWKKCMLEKYPTFFYWDLILRYELLILIFVRAHRERNFTLYREVLVELVPLFFAMDHVNYARWLPVHIRDMYSLPESIETEFKENANWIVSKTERAFSSIPIDQCHEQMNKMVKGKGGVVGLLDNTVALRQWMLAGPERSRLLEEFACDYLGDSAAEHDHHEQSSFTQTSFHKHASDLYEMIKLRGNPFLDKCPELVILGTRDCATDKAISNLRLLESAGQAQYQAFVKDALIEGTRSIHEPIKKNSLSIFRETKRKPCGKLQYKIKSLGNDLSLFGQMYVAVQHRDGDMNQFFEHETCPLPPSLTDVEKIKFGKKSDLLKCLVGTVPSDHGNPPSRYDCTIFDGAAVVHALPPNSASKTFDDYAARVFVAYLHQQLRNNDRVDVVWDTYLDDSLKEHAREKRGQGMRRKVSPKTMIPKWKSFLCHPKNKAELFSFLSTKVEQSEFQADKVVYITSGDKVLNVGSAHTMSDCNHEEADTRIVIHLLHALVTGSQLIQIRTVDTDVVVILLGMFHIVRTKYEDAQIWVGLGFGKDMKHVNLNDIYDGIGEARSRGLPVFHAITGCDTTSAFMNKGKTTAWRAWLSTPDVTDTFVYLAENPFVIVSEDSPQFRAIENFVVALYDQSGDSTSVNEARKNLFCRKSIKSLNRLPPTQVSYHMGRIRGTR